ncbi:hypothetical protein [Novosphingobium sp. LASN5T]|nr:hypothetical protein [Novosphingobium sp. LASN5T]
MQELADAKGCTAQAEQEELSEAARAKRHRALITEAYERNQSNAA